MMFTAFLLAVAVLDLIAAQDAGSFLNPAVGTNTQDYNFNPVWVIGQVQTVEWTTIFSNYSINLWQEALPGGSATVGPAILTTLPGSSSVTQFPWAVQTFQFDLRVSPVFFLWLRPGAPSDGKLSMTSRYFNISSASSSLGTTSTSISTSSPATLSPLSSTTSISTASTQTPGAPAASISTTSTQTTSASVTSALPLGVTSNSVSPKTNGLSTRDEIGLGLGVVIGVALITAIGMFFVLYLRKRGAKRSPLQEQQQEEPQQGQYPKPKLQSESSWQPPEKHMSEVSQEMLKPTELQTYRPPVEMF